MSNCSCEKQDRYANCCYRKIAENNVQEILKDVQGWRALTIKAYKETPVTNPQDHLRETKNKLNLLGVIEVGIQKKLGKLPADIFKEMREREATEGMPEYPNG